MKMQISLALSLTLLGCGAALFGAAGPAVAAQSESAGEQPVKCEDTPTAVRTSFQKLYPKAAIEGCAKEDEKGKAAYEIMSTEGKIKRDVLFYADGTLIVAEEAIAASDLPMAVQESMGEALADHDIELVEKLMRDDAVTYEIKSKHGGVPLEIVFDRNGRILKVAAAHAESAAPEAQEKDEDEGEENEEGRD